MTNETDLYYKYHSKPNCKCVVCGKEMYLRPFRIRRAKNGVTCSRECDWKRRIGWYAGEKNPQYGLKEDLNASFKSWKRENNYGYIEVHKKDHPFCNCCGMVREHRLVVEENAELFDSNYFVVIDGKKYLKPDVEVHHINEIKTDNRIENLIPLSKGEHISLHNNQKEIVRDTKTGRILALKRKNVQVKNKNGGAS